MDVTFYAGAAEAAGARSRELDAPDGLTVADLIWRLGSGNQRLADVLTRCSVLVDGAPARDSSELVPAGARIDVLPPFAGG